MSLVQSQGQSANDQIVADAVKQQVDLLAQWSRFYHDAEIRVNSVAMAISAIAAIGDKVAPSSVIFNLSGRPFNMIGVVIAIASMAAFISTLGYWRYYEVCDLLGKTYRNINLPDHIRKAVNADFEEEFARQYTILRSIPENAHHLVWLVSQVALFCLGMYLAFSPKQQ
jgi:hypothetical protein